MNKKIIAFALAAAFTFSMVGPAIADAATLEEQIAELLAKIVSLEAQIAGQTTPAATAVCFNNDLSKGMTSNDVKNLQIVLNKDTSTQVASSGAGSPGNETTYFGSLTLAAVKTFQTSNGIINTGYVGPLTRGALNALYCTASVPSTTYPAGCTSAVGYSTTTGLPCSEVTTLPEGCTSAVGYSPTTGLSCAGAGTTTTTVGPTEGSVTVTYDPIVINSTTVYKGEDKAVMGIKVKATGSDMRVTRLWLDINTRIWLSADSVALLDGSTVLATLPLSASTVTEITAGSIYRLEFNGLNFIVPIGTTKVLTVKVNRPLATAANADVTVATSSSLRAVDSAGISESYALATRTWVFSSSTAGTGTLTATLNAGSPAIQSVSGISATTGVLTPVKLMDFDLKAKDGPVNVTEIDGNMNLDTGTCALAGAVCFASAELRDGTTVLDSVTGAATFDFTDLNIDIAADTTKTLSIWVQMNPISATVVAGAGIHADIDDLVASTGASFTDITDAFAVTGNIQYLFQYAPSIALVSTSAIQADESTSTTVYKGGNYSIGFTVTAPSGSDICVDRSAAMIVINTYSDTANTTSGISKSNTGTDVGGTLVGAATVSGVSSVCTGSGATAYDKVAAGATRTFTITGYIPHGTAAGYNGMHIDAISWTSTNTSAGLLIQNWGLSDFKTDSTYLTI